MWLVIALIKAGGLEMAACQTSFLSLCCILQDPECDAKIPECKVSSSRSSWSCWHSPRGWDRGRWVEAAPGTAVLHFLCSGVLEQLLLCHNAAPGPGDNLGFSIAGWVCPTRTRSRGEKGFCRSQPSWIKAEPLSGCSGICAPCFRSFTLPGWCWSCTSPADGDLAIN